MNAMKEIALKLGVNIHFLEKSISGRIASDEMQMSGSRWLSNIEVLEPVIKGDEVSVEVIAEVSE